MEDMFNGVDSDEVEEGFAGYIQLTDEFLFDEWQDDEAIEFYEENDLEGSSIAEIAGWVKYCFDKAEGKVLGLPVYFEIHDNSYVLDLQIGEWVDPEEVEL